MRLQPRNVPLAISSCDFALGSMPPDPTKLNVFVVGYGCPGVIPA
jgi:hypothetical protein